MSDSKKHALLSPSSASRWLNCPPSARLCEHREDKGSKYAEEGMQAHSLAEYKLRKYLGQRIRDPTPKLTCFDQSMEDGTDEYVSYCVGEYER
jgi:hypothetical protein